MRKPWRHAEKFFEAIGASHAVGCTRPDQDEHGWDYFVEFPRADDTKVPLDMVEPPVKWLVQIKSTRARSATTSLKLSNALEFSKLDTPCFNVLFVYDATSPTPSYAIVHHFWEDAIRATLRRARELDSRGNRKAHKARIRLPKKKGARVSPDQLFEHIRETIAPHCPNYADKKRLFVETLGFEDSHASGNVTYAAGVTVEDIVDFMIGLKPELPFSHFKMTSVRFGIEAAQPIADVKSGGTLQVTPTPRACELVIASDTTGARVKLQASMFVPGIPDLPTEKMKVRVVADFAEATFSFATGKCDFNFNFQFEEPFDASALLARAELLSVCMSPEIGIKIAVDGNEFLTGNGSTENFAKDGAASVPHAVTFLRHVSNKDTDVRTGAVQPETTLRTILESARRIEHYNACTGTAALKASAHFHLAGADVG